MYNALMEEVLHNSALILHVLGAALILGVAFVTLVIELKKYSSDQIISLTGIVWKIAGIAINLQILTGFYLAWREWDKVGNNPYFWLKLFFFFVIGTIVGTINRRRFHQLKEGKVDNSGVRWAVIGLLTFVLIATLGVLLTESASEMGS